MFFLPEDHYMSWGKSHFYISEYIVSENAPTLK